MRPGSSSEHQEQSSSDRNDPKYKGVRKRKWGKWVSEIRLPNSRERIWLGSYDTPEKAARAFDAALYCLRGPDAKFNFPENPPLISGGQGLSPSEIQVVAARFANEEPPRMSSSTVSDGTVLVDSDQTAIDWSFLSLLDSNEAAADFSLYSGLDHMAGEFYPPPAEPAPLEGNVDYQNDVEPYHQQPFGLWNFN